MEGWSGPLVALVKLNTLSHLEKHTLEMSWRLLITESAFTPWGLAERGTTYTKTYSCHIQYMRHILLWLLHYSFQSDWLCHSHDLVPPPHCRPEGSWQMKSVWPQWWFSVMGQLSCWDSRSRYLILTTHTHTHSVLASFGSFVLVLRRCHHQPCLQPQRAVI